MRTLPLAEAKAHLSALLAEVADHHENITVTRNGAPAAIVVSVDEWEALQETIAVLSDDAALTDLGEAAESRTDGDTYTTEEVLAAFAERQGRDA